jgi:P4 family phage/plasmid primase-like protien
MAASPASNRSHLRFVSRYLQRHKHTNYSLGEWRRYEDGAWKSLADLAVRKECLAVCAKHANGLPVTNALVGSVYGMVQAHVFLPDDTFDSNIDLITFADKTLVVSTGEIRAHSPSDYVTSKLPFSYDPEARSAAWDRVLTATDADNVPFLQEFSGYSLTPSTAHEIGIWSWGEPGSAKSTFIAGLETMLGPRCCTLGLAEIDRSPFALSQLPGKTLAISTEQPSTYVRCFYTLNTLISGESIKWEQKHIAAETRRFHVKLLWAMNELPRIDNAGVGLFRRIIPLPWNKIDNPDPEVKEEVLRSGQAIFNWAYEGLQRLNARGRFDIPAALLAEREAYRVQNDIPLAFISDTFERVEIVDDQGHYVKVWATELYDLYRKWCNQTSHKPFSSIAFAKEMRRLGVEKTVMDGRTFYLGLKSRPEISNEIEVEM